MTEGLASYILLACHGPGSQQLEANMVMKGADWSPYQLDGRAAHLYLSGGPWGWVGIRAKGERQARTSSGGCSSCLGNALKANCVPRAHGTGWVFAAGSPAVHSAPAKT